MERIDFRKQNIPFTQVANGVLYDKKLSLGAKTVYAFMYSKPENWQFSAYRIAQELCVTEPTILKHLRELKEFGYLLSQKLPNGRMLYKIVFPPIEPDTSIFSEGEKPNTKKATLKKSHPEKSSPISNKEIIVISKTSNNTEQSSGHKNFSTLGADVLKTFEVINPACKNFYGRPPQRKACDDLIETYGFDKVVAVVQNTLPRTNAIPYFPSITTPLQLFEKWATLESKIKQYQADKNITSNKNKVAF